MLVMNLKKCSWIKNLFLNLKQIPEFETNSRIQKLFVDFKTVPELKN